MDLFLMLIDENHVFELHVETKFEVCEGRPEKIWPELNFPSFLVTAVQYNTMFFI